MTDPANDHLKWAIAERAAIKKEMDALNARLDSTNKLILWTMIRLGMKTFVLPEFGTLTIKDGSESHGINKEKLMVALLQALPAPKVAEIMAAADKVTVRPPSAVFTPSKPEGE